MNIPELYEIYQQYPSVQTDTRKLQKDDLFFALRGPNFDANSFAETAIANGAAYAIIDDPAYAHIARTILVNDTLHALQQLALFHRNRFAIPFIAITGSNGKTTTKELTHAVLSASYKVYTTAGNLNNHIGVPLTILSIKKDAEMAIIEMGANHPGEIAAYCSYALPTHGLITNCGKAHLEGFGSFEGVKKAKGELYDHLRNNNGTAFVMWDYDYLRTMSRGIPHIVTYGDTDHAVNRNAPAHQAGPEDPAAHQMDRASRADSLQEPGFADPAIMGRALQNETYLQVIVDKGLECERLIRSRLVGSYNLPNILAALAIGKYFKVDEEKMIETLEAYTPSNNRSQLIEKDGYKIILDAYNANPSSMRAAIENFRQIDAENKTLVLGAMAELGADSLKEHQQIIDLIRSHPWKEVVLVGGDFVKLNPPFRTFSDAAEAGKWLRSQSIGNGYLLIKGSRSAGMEKTLEGLFA